MMKRRIWILTAIICLAVCMAGCCLCGAFAEQETITATGSGEGSVRFRVEPEAAEEAYIRQLFGLPVTPVEELPRMRGSTGGDLLGEGTPERALYDALKGYAAEIAAGTRTSTQFVFDNFITFVPEDLDMDGKNLYALWNDETKPRADERMSSIIERAFNAVMFDCPYEMFWVNKGGSTYGSGWSYSIVNSGEWVKVTKLEIDVVVAGPYRDANAAMYGYVVDSNKTEALHTAAANAQAIVNQHTADSDADKLEAYKDAICDLTEYNDDAAYEGHYTDGGYVYEYGDPWQLVWVFDNNSSTKVVCEGYSKAFMYLCDLTEKAQGWSGDVTAICVSGSMATWENGVLDGGPHMWNIVSVDGVNYLVDVTNSDAGSIGSQGGLFMDGYEHRDEQGHTYVYATAGGDVIYAYDTDTVRTFADRTDSAKLNLAGTETGTQQVQLLCDRRADGDGIISLQVHDKAWFTVKADESIRDRIRGSRLVIGSSEVGLNPFDLTFRGQTSLDWTPNDEFGSEMIYTVFAQLKLGEGDEETWISSAPVTVHVTMEKEIEADPEFQTDEQPVEVPLDGMLNIYVGPNELGADYYGCFIEENDKWIADSRWVIAEENGEAEVCMPVFGCTPGTTYDAHFYTVKKGAPIRIAQETIRVTVTAKENAEAPIILDVQDKEDDDNPGERICRYTTEERIRVYALYENPNGLDEETSWIRVRVYEKGNPDNMPWDENGEGFYYWTDALRIGNAGTYIVEAEIMQVVNNDWGNAVPVDGTKTTKEITVTAEEKLPKPRADIPMVIGADEDITIRFRIDGDNLIDRYSFWISPENRNEWVAGGEIESRWLNIDELYREDIHDWAYDYVIAAGTLEGNRAYRVYVDTYARGYNSGHSEYLMLVTGAPEEDEDVISVTGPEQIRFSEDFLISVDAPGCWFTRVECKEAGEFIYKNGEHTDSRFCIDWDPGKESCEFSVIVMYKDGTIKAAPALEIPYDRGEAGSAIPEADAPTLAVDEAQDPMDIPRGQFIRALVGAIDDEGVEEYVVMIREDGSDIWDKAVTSRTAGAVLISTNDLQAGHTYYMAAYARVPGKVRTLSDPVEIGVKEATAADRGLYVNKTSLVPQEQLQFSIVAPGADSIRYCFSSDSYNNGDWWEDVSNWNGDVWQGESAWMRNESYTLKAEAHYEDTGWLQIGTKRITVTAWDDLAQPVFFLPGTLQEGEDCIIEVPEVEHAEEYWIYLNRDDDGREIVCRPGVNRIPGYMLYGGNYHIEVCVSAYGYNMAGYSCDTFVAPRLPEMTTSTGSLSVDGGQAFEIRVGMVPGATHYCLEIHEAGNGNETLILDRDAEYAPFSTVNFTVPAGTLADGKLYRADCYITSTDPEFHPCSNMITLLCNNGDTTDRAINISYVPAQTEFGVNEPIRVTAGSALAKAIIIRCGDRSWGFSGSEATWDISLSEPGTALLYAQAYYTDEEDPDLPGDPWDPAWNDLAWGRPSLSVPLTFKIYGQTSAPWFDMPTTVVQGDMLVISDIEPCEGANEAHANINLGTPEKEGNWVFEDGWHSWNERTRQILMPTSMLEPGEYWVAVDNSGPGLMGNRRWQSFEVTAREGLEEGEILLTAPDQVEDGEALPVSVYAPGAIRVGFCIDPEDQEDTDLYRQTEGEIIYDLNSQWLRGEGEHHVYACALFTQDGEWQFTSKTVEVVPSADEDIRIYCDGNWNSRDIHVLLYEDANFNIYTNYPDRQVEFHYGNDIETAHANEDGYAFIQKYCGEDGTFQAYARMWIEDEDEDEDDYGDEGEGEATGSGSAGGHWIYSNRITVHVDLANPMPEFDPLTYTVTGSTQNIPLDGVLTIEVNNIGADFYGACVTDGAEGEWICDTHWVTQEWATDVTLLHLPLIHCETEGEHDYRVHVYAVKYGVPWFESETVTPITVADAEATDKIRISINDSFVVSAPVCFYASYTGTRELPEGSMMHISVYPEDDIYDYRYDENRDPMDFWESNLRIGMRGTYVLRAEIWGYDEESGENDVFYSATRTFEMTTDPEDNDLEAEFVTQVKRLMTRGEAETITFSYTTENAQHSSVELVRTDTDDGDEWYGRAEVSLWYEETGEGVWIPHIDNPDNGCAHFSIDSNGVLTCEFTPWNEPVCGEYEIRICNDAWNWQTATLNARFRINGPIFRVYENGVKRTVNDETLTGSYYYKIYIEGVDEEECVTLRTNPGGTRQDGYLQYMPHDAHGAYILVLPPDGGAEACTLIGWYSATENSEEVDLVFDLDKTDVRSDALLTFTAENTPVLMQPYTLSWNAVPGAEAYIVHWVTPDGRQIDHVCGSSSLEFSENMSWGMMNNLGLPGEYTVWITAYAGGYAYDYPAATFTAEATDEVEGEVTFTPAPSATPIGIAQEGFIQIFANNIDADYYGAYAVDPADPSGRKIVESNNAYPEEGNETTPLLLSLAGKELEAGDRLEVHVYAGKYGAAPKEAQGTLILEVTDEVLSGGLFQADLPWDEASQSYLVPAYSDFSVLMYMPGAWSYDLYYDSDYLANYYGEIAQANNCEVGPGLHELRFAAYGEEGSEPGRLSIRVTGTTDGDSGIRADVNPMFRPDPESADDFSFAVWNLYQAENEYWKIRLKDIYGAELWSDGSEDGGYAAPAPEDPDEETEQQFHIPAETFEAGEVYYLSIEAHVEGKNPFRQTWAIKTIGQDEAFTGGSIRLTVNGQDKDVEGPAGTEACISVEARGSTAVRIHMPGMGWEYQGDGSGEGYYEWHAEINIGEGIYYAEACYDEDWEEFDWEELNWACGSNAVTVNGITRGTTENPRVTLAGGTADEETGVRIIPQGGTLTVVIDAPEAPEGWPEGEAYPYDANRFGLYIEDSEGWSPDGGLWLDDVTSFPVRAGLNTVQLRTGEQYRVRVYAKAPGKDDGDILSEWFTVTEPAAAASVTLEIMKEPDAQGVYHVLQGEHVQALGTAPGAGIIFILAHDPADGSDDAFDERLWSRDFDDAYGDLSGNCFNVIEDLFSDLQPGTYEIYAATGDYNFDGTYYDRSERLTVSVEMQAGTLLRPVILADAAGAAVNPADELTFSVSGLLQPGANNWDVTVEEDKDRWDRQTVLHRTNRSYTAFDDEGNATFTVPGDMMTAGKRYVIRARVRGIGFEEQEDSAQILAAAAESELRLALSVSKTSVAVKEEFNITIRDTADPADEPDEITAIQVNRGDRRWINAGLENGVFRDTHHFDEPGTMMVSVRYTTDAFDPDEIEDWDDLNWTYSAAVKMTATVRGTMPKPVCELAGNGNHFHIGDMVTVTMTDPEGEAFAGADFGYYADIDRARLYEEGDGWSWDHEGHYDVPGRAKTLMIPTRGLQAGKYCLTVGMFSEGYTDTRTEMIFWIEEPDQPEDPEDFLFIVDRRELKTREEVSMYLYAEDAWRVEVNVTRQGDLDWHDRRHEDRSEGFLSWGAHEAGTYILTPVAYHYDDTITTGTPVSVTVTATDGTLNITEMTMAGTLAEGSDLTVTVTATQTDPQGVTTPAAGAEMHVHLSDVSGYEGVDVTGYDVRLDGNGQGTVTFEAEWFEQGRMYCANADVSRKGFEGAHAEKRTVTIPAHPDTQHTVTLTVDGRTDTDMQIPSSREITVHVNAPGATAVKVMRENTWMCETGESTEGRWGYGDGDKIIVAMACYDDPESWPESWSWDDLNWTGVSNVINVHVQNAGKLGAPVFTLNKSSLDRGETLEVNIPTDPALPEGAPTELHVWYYASIAKANVNDEGRIYSWERREGWNWGWDEQTRQILINTAEFEPGQYRITVGIDAEGWEATQKDMLFELEGLADGTFITDLADNAEVPIYHSDDYMVMISGADGITQEVLKLNEETGNYEERWDEGYITGSDYGHFNVNFSEEGSYRTVFRGQVNGETITETIDFTVISYGTLNAPKIRMDEVWTSGGLQFTVVTEEQDTRLTVEVSDWDGMLERLDDADHNQRFSADLFETGKDYYIWIAHNKEGYYSNSSYFTVRRIAASKTLRLPAALLTIEDEAFAGIAAELVIIPGNTTTIGENAFDGSQLKAIFIPDNVTSIHPYAFGDIYQLTVYGHEGSYAESFANEKGFDFIAVN